MRLIIPKEIAEMQDKYAPYMHYVKGQGMVLDSDAPLEIVALKKTVDEWFLEHRRNY